MGKAEIGIEEARKVLGPLADAAFHHGQTTLLTRNRKPVAMIVPAPLHLQIRHITVEVFDQGDWREQAINDWLEAAAGEGYGFTVLHIHDDGDEVLAVLARDEWRGDELVQGERIALRVDRPGLVEPGQGEALSIEPAPYDDNEERQQAAQHPLRVLLSDVFPWVRHLSPDEVSAFEDELRKALSDAAEGGATAAPQEVISGWRATARIKMDPAEYARTRVATSGDYGPVQDDQA